MHRVFSLGSKTAESEVVKSLRAGFATIDDAAFGRTVTLYDTSDRRLLADHGTLEAWTDDGTSVVAWHSTEKGLLHRLIGQPVPAFARDLAPGPFRRALEERIAVRRLLPQVRLELRTRTLRFVDENQKTVARVVFERGSAVPVDAPTSRRRLPATVSVQPVRGYDAIGDRITDFLEARLGLAPAAPNPLVRALNALGRPPASREIRTHWRLVPDMTALEALRQILDALLESLRLNEDGVRRDLDPEFLHDYRVAVRRTRSALGSIKGVLQGERFDHFREEFGWLGGLTGPVRDLDVHLLNLPHHRELLPVDLRRYLDPLESVLGERKRIEHGHLVAGLDSPRYATLLQDWPVFLDSGEERGPQAASRVTDVATKRLRKAWKRVLELGRSIEPHSAAATLHELRIACKKLRYLLEFFSDLYPAEDVGRLIRRLKRLQDPLGRFNDLEIERAALGETSERSVRDGGTDDEGQLAFETLGERMLAEQTTERALVLRRFARFASRGDREHARKLFTARRPEP